MALTHSQGQAGTAPALLPLVFERPSRTGGEGHRVQVNPVTLRPLGCGCPAGRRNVVCWAALDVARVECVQEARRRWNTAKGFYSVEFAQAVATLRKVNARRAIAETLLEARPARASTTAGRVAA